MSESVLDASVLLACLLDERSDAVLVEVIRGAAISTVNLSEVLAKMEESGIVDAPRSTALSGLLGRIEPFTKSQARQAASLKVATKKAGLSLADRACRALAMELKLPAYTADRAWATLGLDCEIILIR